ncbi:MAG: response regulator [Candidatus Schekmanbacteria bacterium]|nr:MAG: response regulator [Candidatus Schekmanbacteria bacterium]
MKKILVIDDEENIRNLYQAELSDEGYEVITAEDEDDALELLKTESPDLITLDIKLKKSNGVELLRKIKEIDKKLPVIMCTAYDEYKQDFGVWASDAYVVKSSDLTELKEVIKEILQ